MIPKDSLSTLTAQQTVSRDALANYRVGEKAMKAGITRSLAHMLANEIIKQRWITLTERELDWRTKAFSIDVTLVKDKE